MNILADKYLFKLHDLLPQQLNLTLFNPNHGLPNSVSDYDALLIRTVTKIDENTLPKAGNLKFIGSASAGYDHVDTEHLEKLNIQFSSAAGCNANAVAEYIITAMLRWADVRGEEIYSKTIGVVGCGHTGGSVIKLLENFGISHIKYDPPKAAEDCNFISSELKDLLKCDILTFHTPLTRTGNHPTYHLCNTSWLDHKFDLIINAARGGVVKERDLLAAKADGTVKDFILDVWENEPTFNDQTAGKAFITTPHIAGHSKEAKFRASKIIIDELLAYFDIKAPVPVQQDSSNINLQLLNGSFSSFLWKNHKIEFYDSELRKLIGMPDLDKAIKFADLRSEAPLRTEFGSYFRLINDHSKLPKDFTAFKPK